METRFKTNKFHNSLRKFIKRPLGATVAGQANDTDAALWRLDLKQIKSTTPQKS